MKHRTALAYGAIAGSSRSFRLDPSNLPVRYSASLTSGDDRIEATIIIDRDQAIVQQLSPVETAKIIRIPNNVFEGVAVHMTPLNQDGDIEIVVELMHRDPTLCLPLMIAEDPAEVAADWQEWGRILGLPLLMVEQDGTIVMPEDRPNTTTPRAPKPRRHHSHFAKRRPRFLTRRKTGRSDNLAIIEGREMIARS